MRTNIIFAQYKLAAGETHDLYQVPELGSAVGTLYISAQQGYDVVSVKLMKAADPESDSQYIVRNCSLVGRVPIYLQQLHLGQFDTIRISSVTGDTSYTFTGELTLAN